jgi:type IVB pilus formation R64 PilN family outer membrane protein
MMKAKTFTGRFIALAVASTILGGCSSWLPKGDADTDKEARYNQIMGELQKSRAKQGEERQFFSNTPWIVGTEVKFVEKYPELSEIPITLAEYDKRLPQLIKRLQEMTDYSYQLNSDLYAKPVESEGIIESGEGGGDSLGTDSAGNPSSTSQLLGASALGTPRQSGDIFDDPTKQTVSVVMQDGNLKRVLDQIVSQLSINWRFDKARERIEFYRLDKRNFQIYFPGESETEIEVGGSGESADSVISQTSKFTFDGGTWDEVSSGVDALLSPWGDATIIKSTGNVIVKDTPRALEDIEDYVRDVNDIYGRQVYLEIRTASVKMEDANNFNLTWNNILNAVNGGEFQIGGQSADVATSALPNALNVIRPSNGANLALELLATKSKNIEMNEQSVTTLSNQPASLKVLTETGFISNISQQGDGSELENVVSDVETDTIESGFDATLIPRVVNKKRLQLQVALELSGNLTLQTFDSSIVQTPTQDRNTVVQRSWLNTGETWVIAAFKGDRSSEEEQGSGTSGFWGLGGGTSKSKSEQVLLIMITPQIQDGAYVQ